MTEPTAFDLSGDIFSDDEIENGTPQPDEAMEVENDGTNMSIDLFDSSDSESPQGDDRRSLNPISVDGNGATGNTEEEQEHTLMPGPSSPMQRLVQIQNPTSSSRVGTEVERSFHEQRERTLAQMEKPDCGMWEGYAHYMRLKKDKLNYQVNVLSKPKTVSSALFQGVSIFVNGHTDPTALELRELIQAHGGEYHCYMEYGRTTYTIASSLAAAKVDKLRKNEKFILPSWIVDCIASGKRLPDEDYLLLPNTPATEKPITSFFRNGEPERKKDRILDARDPDFLQEFYSRSRLHLISTLAQDMKDYMNGLRESQTDEVAPPEDLAHLRDTNTSLSEPIIFHVDLDCFFVSVALRDKPDLVGQPVAITHSKGSSNGAGFSEIASCSYAARRLGVKNGMLVRDALKLCPAIVCLPYQFEEYRTVSKCIYTILSRYTLEVRAVSCDEMFVNFTRFCKTLNISNVTGLAEHIRAEIKIQTACPASVGIGPTVLIARLATRHAKPDGVCWIRQSEVIDFISKERVDNLPGVGHAMVRKLGEQFGSLEECRDLQAVPQKELEELLGKKLGQQVFKLCRGEDDSLKDFLACTVRKSVSCDINYGIRFTKKEEVVKFLGVIGSELSRKLALSKMTAGALTLKLMIRSVDAPIETAKYLGHGKCDTVNRSVVLSTNTASPEDLTRHIIHVFDQLAPCILDLRGIGVQCTRLQSDIPGGSKAKAMKDFFRKGRTTTATVPVVPEKRTEKRAAPAATVPIFPKKRSGILQLRDRPASGPIALPSAPAFLGESKPIGVRKRMREVLEKEPTDVLVHSVVDYLVDQMLMGNLCSLLSICKYLYRTVHSPSSHPNWFFSVNFIFSKVDGLLRKKYGAPMIVPALEGFQV